MRYAFVLCALVLAGCITPGDVLPAGNDTYKISIPTSKIAVVTTCAACVTPQAIRDRDIAAAATHAMQRAHQYCARKNRTAENAGGGFDAGSGLTLIFRCVPPQQGAANPQSRN
jgi:hypothetical protein